MIKSNSSGKFSRGDSTREEDFAVLTELNEEDFLVFLCEETVPSWRAGAFLGEMAEALRFPRRALGGISGDLND